MQDRSNISSYVRGRHALVLIAICALPCVTGAGQATALEPSALPAFDGSMSFRSILDASDPQEYSWEVELGVEQELKPVDEQHVAVYYSDGQVAIDITAESAHDAKGSGVPTSLAVSDGNVITLLVHHRAGNPAAGGAPFAYPVSAGAGWQEGFSSVQLIEPPQYEPAPEDPAVALPAGCIVPKLTGRSLRVNRRVLRKAGCELPTGAVAVVSGVPSPLGTITRAELRRSIAQASAQAGLSDPPGRGDPGYKRTEERALGELLEMVDIEGEAAELGVTVTQPEISSQLAAIKAKSFRSAAEYRAYLRQVKLTEKDVRERVKLQILATRIQTKVLKGLRGSAAGKGLREYVRDYTMRWRSRTICAPQIATDKCANGPSKEAGAA